MEPVRKIASTTRVRVDRYHPDFTFIESLGVRRSGKRKRRWIRIPSRAMCGIHLAGVVMRGHTGEISSKRTLPWEADHSSTGGVSGKKRQRPDLPARGRLLDRSLWHRLSGSGRDVGAL